MAAVRDMAATNLAVLDFLGIGKVDLLGTDRPLEVTRRFARPCTDVAVILNANAACPAAVLDGVIRSAVEETSDRYQLELRYFKKECFNLGE